jgi:hypothetical protein
MRRVSGSSGANSVVLLGPHGTEGENCRAFRMTTELFRRGCIAVRRPAPTLKDWRSGPCRHSGQAKREPESSVDSRFRHSDAFTKELPHR